jgi:hypothetical protein
MKKTIAMDIVYLSVFALSAGARMLRDKSWIELFGAPASVRFESTMLPGNEQSPWTETVQSFQLRNDSRNLLKLEITVTCGDRQSTRYYELKPRKKNKDSGWLRCSSFLAVTVRSVVEMPVKSAK